MQRMQQEVRKAGEVVKSAVKRERAWPSVRVRQADWQPEHLVVHGVGVVDLVSVGGAPRAEVVVLVGAGAGALLDEEEADDAGAVGKRAAAVRVVVADDVV